MASSISGHCALLERLDLSPKQKKDLEKLFSKYNSKNKVNILVAGKTGSGKSKLVNALCGSTVTKEGEFLTPETAELTPHLALTNEDYTVNVWDSPGFLDGTDREFQYLQAMKHKCRGEVDMLLYCVEMSSIRADVEEITKGMELVTRALSKDAWRHAMVVLTFANLLEDHLFEDKKLVGDELKQRFQQLLKQWKDKVGSAFEKARIPSSIAQQIPIEPAGERTKPHLPDRVSWLGYLWIVFFHQAKDEAKLGLLVNIQERLWSSRFLQPHAHSESDQDQEPHTHKPELPRIFIDYVWLGTLARPLNPLITSIMEWNAFAKKARAYSPD